MDYMDREGHRIKKTTSQDKFLKFVYTHTATRVLMRPLLYRQYPDWEGSC